MARGGRVGWLRLVSRASLKKGWEACEDDVCGPKRAFGYVSGLNGVYQRGAPPQALTILSQFNGNWDSNWDSVFPFNYYYLLYSVPVSQ